MKQKMRVERDVHVFVFSSASLSIRTFDRQTLAHTRTGCVFPPPENISFMEVEVMHTLSRVSIVFDGT